MTLTFGDATTEIKEHFHDKWDDGLANGLENRPPIVFKKLNNEIYTPEIDWRNVEEREKNDLGEHFCRFKADNNVREQTTFADSLSVGKRFTTLGVLSAQLFLSKSSYTTEQHYRLAEICEAAFDAKATVGGVWFRNTTIRNLEPLENYFRCNVTSEYIFDSCVT